MHCRRFGVELLVLFKVEGGLTDPDAQHALQYWGLNVRLITSKKLVEGNVRFVIGNEQQGEPTCKLDEM